MERATSAAPRRLQRFRLLAGLSGSLMAFVLAWPSALQAQQGAVATTTVEDTVYTAAGTPASGSVLISWPAFTTSGGTSIPAGSTSATIGANGKLSIALAPDAGATPMGSFYTAVFHLNDGSTSRQYWVVPATVAGGGPVKLAAIQNQVLPTSVAMQTVSKQYVDTAISKALTGVTPDDPSEPYVLKAGDTMTGPLVLPGDPVNPTQAADKNYVDGQVQGVAAGLGQKVSLVPGATQQVIQPAGTQLQVNELNGVLDAQVYQDGGGSNGVVNAAGSSDCANGCEIHVNHTYTGTDAAQPAQLPAQTHVLDQRGGTELHTFVDPLAVGASANAGEQINFVATRSEPALKALRPSSPGINSAGLSITQSALAGGNNLYPGNIENVPYGKSTFSAISLFGRYNTQGQHVQLGNRLNCYSVGDCLAGSQYILSSGGYRDLADEGTHPYDLFVSEDGQAFKGTCQNGCSTGSTSVGIAATAYDQTEGDGRFLIDTTPGKVINTGSLVGSGFSVFVQAHFAGTNFPLSTFLMTAQPALSQPGNMAPGTETLAIATTGLPAGFVPNTAALPVASGVACVADRADSGNVFPNFETASFTVVDGTHIQLTLNKPHFAGAVIAVGGLCGYGLEQTADTFNGVKQVFPVIGSFSGTELYYAAALTSVVGNNSSASTSGWQNFGVQVSTAARQNGTVTVTTAQPLPYDFTGLTLTVAGVTDPSYNGSFTITTTGQNSFTYASAGPDSTSSGGTVSILTGGYNLYPMAEVLSVLDPATRTVDGTLTLAANTVPWAPGDTVEQPHYYQQIVAADTESVTQYVPRPIFNFSAGKSYSGNLGPGARGWAITNDVPTTSYLGGGGTHQPPDAAFYSAGVWRNTAEYTAGTESLFRIHCNLHGCNRWNSGYALFALDSSRGEDFISYDPNSSNLSLLLGGSSFDFGTGGFTAPTINVGTLNATHISGAVMGASGGAHAAGLVPDPGASAGTSRFLREDGTWAAPAGGGSVDGGSASTPVTAASCGSSYTLNFAAAGDVTYDVTLTGNCTLSLATPPNDGTYRRITLILRPNGHQATLPASSAAMAWSGGSVPTPSTAAYTVITFGSTGIAPVFGGI